MNPALLLRTAQILALVCVILFLPLSGISLGMALRRSRRDFPKILLLLPCMSVVLALALGLYVMGQLGRLMLSFPELIPDLVANGSWLLQIQVVNALYPPVVMVGVGIAYLLIFALCLIPGRRRSTDSANGQDNRERQQ